MRLIAIDQSANLNGRCLYDDGQYQVGDFKLTKTGPERMRQLEKALYGLLCPPPDLVIVEKPLAYSPKSRGGSGIIVHRILGAIDSFCATHYIPVLEINPVHVKQWSTGKGNAGKPDIKLAAESVLGYSLTSADGADAYFLCAITLGALQEEEWRLKNLTPLQQAIALGYEADAKRLITQKPAPTTENPKGSIGSLS